MVCLTACPHLTQPNLTQFVATTDHIASNLAGETVILHLQTGVYYGLNEVGSQIWHCIQQPQTSTAIRDLLLADYDIEPLACEQAVEQLLQSLIQVGLVEVVHGAGI